jgi:hypothetical protein
MQIIFEFIFEVILFQDLLIFCNLIHVIPQDVIFSMLVSVLKIKNCPIIFLVLCFQTLWCRGYQMLSHVCWNYVSNCFYAKHKIDFEEKI